VEELKTNKADVLCAAFAGPGVWCPLPRGHAGPHRRSDDGLKEAKQDVVDMRQELARLKEKIEKLKNPFGYSLTGQPANVISGLSADYEHVVRIKKLEKALSAANNLVVHYQIVLESSRAVVDRQMKELKELKTPDDVLIREDVDLVQDNHNLRNQLQEAKNMIYILQHPSENEEIRVIRIRTEKGKFKFVED
jgi:hypothetical protein